MTNFTALADAIVRQGIGHKFDPLFDWETFYCPHPKNDRRKCLDDGTNAENFVKDARVVLALIEKVDAIESAKTRSNKWVILTAAPDEAFDTSRETLDESLPVAIVEACLKALGEDV